MVLFLLLHEGVGVVNGGVDLAVVDHVVGLGDLRDLATMSGRDNPVRMATSGSFAEWRPALHRWQEISSQNSGQ